MVGAGLVAVFNGSNSAVISGSTFTTSTAVGLASGKCYISLDVLYYYVKERIKIIGCDNSFHFKIDIFNHQFVIIIILY